MRLFFVFACFLLLAPGIARAHDGLLPLGDGKVSDAPKAGWIYSCQQDFNARRAGARHAGAWIEGDQWDPAAKPAVQGSVSWPEARLTITVQGDRRIVSGNGLPSHPTGIFPIQESDPAYAYDRNPNTITAQSISLDLPVDPQLAAQASCVPMGMIGVMLDGVALFNGLDAGGRDAAAHEVQDACNAHPERNGMYHYHNLSPCLHDDSGAKGVQSPLLGYALDGFGIYGKYGEGGRVLHNADLDACHGRTSTVMWNGRMQSVYHYVLTDEYPYTIGCFRGTPVTAGERRRGMNGQGSEQGQAGRPQDGQGPARGRVILEQAARSLGLDPRVLGEAVGPPPPDFHAAAQKLGIDEDRLRAAFRNARQGAGQ